MKQIATTINRTSLTRKLTLLLLFTTFFQFTSKAMDYYWVGGSGNWSDLNHWATTSGGTGGLGIPNQPFTTDDVFFNSASGFTVGNATVTLDLAVAKNAHDITVNVPGITLNWVGSTNFQFYGDMHLLTAVNFGSFTGTIRVYQEEPVPLSTKIINTSGNIFYSPVVFMPNQSNNTIITSEYKNRSTTTLDLASSTDKVTFSFSAALGDYVEVKKGEAHFNQGLAPILLPASPNLLIRQAGSLYASNNCIAKDLFNAGYVNLNEANSAPNHQFRSIDIYTVETQTVASTLDFHGSTVNITDFWRYGRSNSTLYSINAAGSTLNFNASALNFYPLEYTFNNVIVSGGGTPFRFVYEYVTSPTNPNFNLLKLERSTNMQFVSPGGVLLLPTVDSMHLIPGCEYSYRTLVSSIEIAEAPGATCRFVCNKLSQVGTCEKPITINRLGYSLGAASTVHSQYIISKDIMAQGPATPYLPGTGSISILGSHPGWDFTPIPPASRTLVWVGPAPVNINDSTSYKRWESSLNWRDFANDPGAFNFATGGPGYYGLGLPACPPTKVDSVVFLNNSYVRIDSITNAYARSINWIGNGRLNATDFKKLEIWGALTLSDSMRNDFYGTVYFKNDRPYRCAIQTRSRPFRKGVVFDAALASSSWLLKDSIIALKMDPNCNGPLGAQSMRISSGHLHTGTINCGSGINGALQLFGLFGHGGALSLYDSDIHIMGGSGSSVVLDILGTTINPGTSHFICKNTIGGGLQSLAFGDGKHYYEITLDRPTPPVSISDFSHNVFLTKDTIQTINATVNSSPWFFTKLTANAGLVRKLDLHTAMSSRSIFSGDNGTNSDVYSMTIDSLYLYGLVYHGMRLKVRSYLNMSPGHYSYFYTTAPPLNLELMGATPSFPNNIFNSCVAGSSSYSGATTSINGSCTLPITIEGGIINVVSPTPVTASYLNLVNNSIIGSGGSYTNSTTSGTVTGWSGAPATPRLLRWKDATASANHNGNWNDPTYWEQILPNGTVLFPAPQCPPTKIDTALFDNTSFSATGQIVTLNGSYEVGSMYWRNISVYAIPPRLAGSNLTEMKLFGSLEFHQNMSNNYMGSFRFKGVPTVAHPVNHITMNQKSFQRFALFDADADATEWHLNDSMSFSLYAPNIALLSHYRGRLITNGNPIYIAGGGLDLDFSTNRYFNFANSRIYCGYGNFRVLNPATVTIVSTNSKIFLSNGTFIGGGKVYNDLIGVSSNGGIIGVQVTTGDVFNVITLNNSTTLFTGGSGLVAKKISNNTSILTYNTPLSEIDTMLLLGSSSTILTSNKYHKAFEVAPGTTLILGTSSVQWFQNKCNVDLIGQGTPIQMYSTTAGSPAYMRKDSATVCADFINIRDVWGIGNGNNIGLCNSFASDTAVTNCPPSPANAWIVSTCDTVTDFNSSCGPWEIANPLRGRAAFTAGINANPQGNTGGWDFRAYPPVPSISLASSNPSICEGQSVTLSISGIAKIPFTFYYSDSDLNDHFVTITNAGQLASYNTTTHAFTYTVTVTPATSISYEPGTITIDRCFNNTSAIGSGSLNITVNPIPSITNGGLTQAICSGTTGAFTATTSVPSTIAWTSPAVGGITGHSLSGSGSISEILTNSTASPLNVVYTLTPTAAGCTGLPSTHTITVNPRPNAVAGPAQSMSCITPTATVTVSSSTPGVDYSWTGPSVTAGATTNAATVDAIGTYTVIVTNPVTGCASSSTVSVNFAPDVTPPVTPTLAIVTGQCSATVTAPTTTDNCAGTITGTTANPLTYSTQGTFTVNWTFNDGNGQSITVPQTVIIDDVTPPVTPTLATLTGQCSVTVTAPTTTDNCAGTITGTTVNPLTYNTEGTFTVNWTLNDGNGQSITVPQTVIIDDVTPPVTPTLATLTGQCSAVVPVPTTTDNCAGIIFGTTSDPLTYNSQGTFTVTWTFNDGNGNSTTATQTVIVDNNLPPVPPVLPDIVAECNATVPTPVSTTNCSGPATGTTTDPTSYSAQGNYVVTWSFDDGTGNIVTAPQNVFIDDVTPPVTPVLSAISDECTVTLTAPTTTDNCAGTVTATTSDPLIYNSQGTFTVDWTFDDNNGNTSTVSQTVTINDVTPPTINGCPTNIAANNDPGQCTATVNWVAPIASDNCAGVTLTSTHASGSTFPTGTTTVTYTATDAGGNTVSCSFDVTVTENEAPVIAGCPGNITTGNDAGDCGANVNWNVPTATDNCPGVTLTSTHNPGDAFPTGTTTVTYTATDAAGNTVTCSFDVTVNDTENPVITGCPSAIAIGNTTGNCDGIASWTVPTVSDNCPGVTLTGSHAPGDVFPLGTTTVTYTATDAAGNTSAICSFDVTVTDQENPVIAGLGDLSICEGGTVTWTPFITDNCPGVTFTSTHNPGDVFQLGTTTVSYTATDAAGNTSTASFNVDIYPLTPMVIEMNPTEVCAGEPLSLNIVNMPANGTYEWSLNGVVVSTNPSYVLTSTSLLDNGVYDLIVTQPGGCESYGQFTISLNPCDIIIPEALTPNGDGSNDLFAIENLENYPNSSVQIVNRWGNVVFESDDYKNDWDGTSYSNLNIGGNQLPEGTFYYVLTIGGETDTKLYGKVYTGYVYLKR
jgi:gliding motility-associated-like protein